MNRITWHGTLEGVELADGTVIDTPPVALGTDSRRGLVTARTREALLAGAFITRGSGRYRPIAAVLYRRRRKAPHAGFRWRHELTATGFRASAAGPVFSALSRDRLAHVCAFPAGDFICEG